MARTTITEALAEVKTILKRIEKKQEFVVSYLYRQDTLKDPHEKDGGSFQVVARELQAIRDLDERIVAIRRAIQGANAGTVLTIKGDARSVADWLTWKREVAPRTEAFLDTLAKRIQGARTDATRRGLTAADPTAGKQADVVINVNENALAQEIEALQETLGALDGQLSLLNATVTIEL